MERAARETVGIKREEDVNPWLLCAVVLVPPNGVLLGVGLFLGLVSCFACTDFYFVWYSTMINTVLLYLMIVLFFFPVFFLLFFFCLS